MVLTSEQKEINLKKRREKEFNKTHKFIDGVDYKFCNIRYKHFPEEDPWLPATLEYFYKNKKNGMDGLYPSCKRCDVQKSIQQWKDDPIEHRELHKKFEKTKKFKKWMRKNQIEFREYRKQYIKDNKEKMKKYAKNKRMHDITSKEWKAVQKYFNYKCAYCGKTLKQQYKDNNEQFHKEHVEHDGHNDIRNCVPACTNCNSTKRKRNIQELFDSCDIINFNEKNYNKIILWCKNDYLDYIETKPPYRITRKQNEDNKTYHWQLWTVDEKKI